MAVSRPSPMKTPVSAATNVQRLTLLAECAGLCLLLTGCSLSIGSNNICTTQTVVSDGKTAGSANFTVSAPGADFTIYPGQTTTVPVTVSGSGNGPVTLTVTGLPSGVTVQPVSAMVGSTANLTFVSTPALAAECFRGTSLVYSAYSAVAIQATGSGGTTALGYGMDVTLENPAFTPAKTDLPTLTIVTDGGAEVASKDDYVTGTMSIADPRSSKNAYTGTMSIKGHGNTTWQMPKKPYRLKLDSKSKLLGMNSEKNWILLANYDDKTMLRDAVASYVSNITGVAWAPASAWVELTMNGQYMGVYELIEKIDINSSRIDIPDSDDSTDPTKDGYLEEIDHWQADEFHWLTPHGLPVGSADPDPPTAAQEAYIQPLVNTAEASFYSPAASDATTGWRSTWTEDSVVGWFITNELMGTHDANGQSTYFYKDAGVSPFVMGPVWDVDISSGNDNYGAIVDPNVPWVSTQHAWFAALITNDPTFVTAVKARWAAMRSQVGGVPAYIDAEATTLTQGASNNYQRWPTLHQKVWPNPEAAGSFPGEISYFKTWMTARIAYMDKTYGQ